MKESDIIALVNQLDNMLMVFNREQMKENVEKTLIWRNNLGRVIEARASHSFVDPAYRIVAQSEHHTKTTRPLLDWIWENDMIAGFKIAVVKLDIVHKSRTTGFFS